MILLYLVSTLYHALPAGRAKAWLNRFDHAAIYVFIAGSYTPFTLGVLRGAWGWTLFGIVWGVAAFGVTVKLLNRLQHPLLVDRPVRRHGLGGGGGRRCRCWRACPPPGLAWLVAGGLSYTLGAVVFLFDHRVRYAHFVWHLFVLGGSVCHFFAALWFARG